MLWLQVLERRNSGLRWFHRRGNSSCKGKAIDASDDTTLELVSNSTDVSEELDTHSCLQQLVMEDQKNIPNSCPCWENVRSNLMTTLAHFQKTTPLPLTQYNCDYDEDDDNDDDAFQVLYYGGHSVVAEQERRLLSSKSQADVAEEKMRYDSYCAMIHHEFQDLYEQYDVLDLRMHQSLLIILISQDMEEDGNHSLHVEDAIRTVASFLIDPSIHMEMKLAVLQIMLLPHLPSKGHDDISSSSTLSAPATSLVYGSGVENDCSIIVQQQILREVYAFCIAICFGVSDLEYALTANNSSAPLVSPMLWELRSTCLYLQEVHSIFYDLSNSRPMSNPSAAISKSRNELQWEQVKSYLFEANAILLKDLDFMRTLFNELGIGHVVILASVGYLRICAYSNPSPNTMFHTKYYEALHNLAQFLADWIISDRKKIAVLKCLSVDPTVLENRLNFSKVLSFCVDPHSLTDSFLLTNVGADREMDTCSYYLLLWELRVLCGHYFPQQQIRHHLRLFWTKTLPRVRVLMAAVGSMKRSVGVTVVSYAQTVVAKSKPRK